MSKSPLVVTHEMTISAEVRVAEYMELWNLGENSLFICLKNKKWFG